MTCSSSSGRIFSQSGGTDADTRESADDWSKSEGFQKEGSQKRSPRVGPLSQESRPAFTADSTGCGNNDDCAAGTLVLWRDYNGRATIEQRIEELKAELAADGFCMQNFFATESAFLAVLFTFNLLSLYQKALQPSAAYRQPATLRATVFLGGAIPGHAARKAVLYLSNAWGGLEKHKPLLEAILQWPPPTSPKLDSSQPPPTPATAI